MSSITWKQALSYWKGKKTELSNQLTTIRNINAKNYFQKVKIWYDLVRFVTNKQKNNESIYELPEANIMRLASNDKTIARSFDRITETLNPPNIVEPNEYFNIMNETNLNLADIHNKLFSINNDLNNYQVEGLRNLISNIDLNKNHILVKLDAKLPDDDKPIS